MPANSKNNRIAPLFVGLLYLFLSTFGAVAHTHTSPNSGRYGATSRRGQTAGPGLLTVTIGSEQRDCAACEWLALSVTHSTSVAPDVGLTLLLVTAPAPVLSTRPVCVSPFSSRAPPAS